VQKWFIILVSYCKVELWVTAIRPAIPYASALMHQADIFCA